MYKKREELSWSQTKITYIVGDCGLQPLLHPITLDSVCEISPILQTMSVKNFVE